MGANVCTASDHLNVDGCRFLIAKHEVHTKNNLPCNVRFNTIISLGGNQVCVVSVSIKSDTEQITEPINIALLVDLLVLFQAGNDVLVQRLSITTLVVVVLDYRCLYKGARE